MGVDAFDVLHHVSLLGELLLAAAHGAHERLLVAVHAQVRVELPQAAENLAARFPLLRLE